MPKKETGKQEAAKMTVGTKEWYEARRELYVSQRDESRYYDLPLLAIMELVHKWENENDCKLVFLANQIPALNGWVNVEVSIYKNFMMDENLLIKWIGSVSANEIPETGDVSPYVGAESQGLKSALKKIIMECNLPYELSIVGDEVPVAVNPTPVEVKKPLKLKFKHKEKPETSETAEEVQEVVEESAVEEVLSEEIVPVTLETSELEEAYNYVVPIGTPSVKGKTLRELSETPNGPQFLTYYSSKIGDKKFEQYQDLCRYAKVLHEHLGIGEIKPKH